MQGPQPRTHAPAGRRRFLAAAGAWILTPLLLNCRQPAAGATQRDPGQGPLNVADFREPGLSDREVLRRAFQAWTARGRGTLHLERDRVYDLGRQLDGRNVFVVFGLVDAVLAGNGATFRLHSEVQEHFNILYFAHYRNFRVENLSCVDTGYRGGAYGGGKFIVLDAGDRESLDISLDNLAGEGLVSFIHIQGRPGGPRVRGVRIAPNCRATRVFYALPCLDNGDDVSGGFSTFNCARSYFPRGVTGHDLRILINHRGAGFGPIAETAVLIKTYGQTTSHIRLDAVFSGVLATTGSCVTLEHQHDPSEAPSVIEDVDLRITIAPGTEDPHQIARLTLRSYSGSAEETGRTRNVWRRIRLGGNLGPGTGPAIYARVQPDQPADIIIAPGTVGADAGQVAAAGFRIVRP